jgi:hypothetical protein
LSATIEAVWEQCRPFRNIRLDEQVDDGYALAHEEKAPGSCKEKLENVVYLACS